MKRRLFTPVTGEPLVSRTFQELWSIVKELQEYVLRTLTLKLEGVKIGTRPILNLKAGTGITITASDNARGDVVDVTISLT